MFDAMMDDTGRNFVCRSIAFAERELGLDASSQRFWVCYGSFALGRQTPESDVDLLCVHELDQPLRRHGLLLEGRRLTVYSANRHDFRADGAGRKYGGYLSGKSLNPCVLYPRSAEAETLFQKTAGEWIGPLMAASAIAAGRSTASTSSLVAESVLARLGG